MLTCSTVRTKDCWLITKFQNLWPRRFTMLWHLCQSTLSKPHQIQWVLIHFCCSSNWLLWGTDVFKYELCVYPPALCEATGTVLQSDIPSQANAIQGWVHPSSTQIPQDDSYIYNWNVLIQKISMENRADYWVTEHFKKEIWPTKVLLFDAYPGGPCTKTIVIWDGRNYLAVTLLIRKRHPRYTA